MTKEWELATINGMMGGMMWVMVLVTILVIVVLILAEAALFKYVRSPNRKE